MEPDLLGSYTRGSYHEKEHFHFSLLFIGYAVKNPLKKEDRLDPQQTVSQAYNTVLLPMDDGNWHVTVYCPAALDASLLDKDANELDPDQVKAGDEAYTVISATGYGTVQHPCRTVEVVVGGQKPFWSLRNTQ